MLNSEVALISELSVSELDAVAAGTWDLDQASLRNLAIGFQSAPTTNVAAFNLGDVSQSGSYQDQTVNSGNIFYG